MKMVLLTTNYSIQKDENIHNSQKPTTNLFNLQLLSYKKDLKSLNE